MGFDEYPLETLKRPLDLDLSDDEDVARPPTPARLSEEEDARRDRARNHCERLLHTESVSSRLVSWMAHEGVADVDGVADALAQMHAVRLSPPSAPPGGLSVPPDDDDLSLFLYKSTSVRREAVSKALKAIIGPLALAFACQGNWLMRRQVLVLVRDGRSRIDTEALAEAAGNPTMGGWVAAAAFALRGPLRFITTGPLVGICGRLRGGVSTTRRSFPRQEEAPGSERVALDHRREPDLSNDTKRYC